MVARPVGSRLGRLLRPRRRAATPPARRPVSRGEHDLLVHGELFPAADAARFLRAGLDEGEAGLVIATADHAALIRAALGDIEGDCAFLDATTELGRCCV